MRAITTFLALSFGLSWAVAAWIHQSGGFAGLGAAMGTVSLMLFMLGPSIAAVVCTLLFDRDRWADALGFRGFGFGKVASWTVLSWITAIALTIASVLATVHVFGQQLGDPLTFMQTQLDAQGVEAPMPIENLLMIQMTVGLSVGLLFNTFYLLISEELGWRGWLQPRLADLGFWPASIVIGVIWGLWHLPIILMGHNYGDLGWTGVAAMVGFTVMLTPYHALARERGGVIAAAGMHGAINAVAGFSLMYLASPAWPWNGLTGVGGFAAMGGGWGLIFLYRMGRRKPATG
ncbi:CPBP family intramembrane glutamic endopeptidase [Maricaulis sp.]|uniref:CPBP family intramembrane glutamic endopeptidase n=1 Tax=Maricaulis sp. TaxID=1486257 RepID=UPI0025BB01C1|nr:CPBP family intramembrane glutamic endopeptidase [Maricaulis sp.]